MQKKFLIKWMTCPKCLGINQDTLNNLNWIYEVTINFKKHEAIVSFDEEKLSFDDIKKEVEKNWFKVIEWE